MKLWLFSALLLISAPSHAYFQTGNDLVANMHEWEKSNQGANRYSATGFGIYTGYIFGVHDAYVGYLFCTPDEAKGRQVFAVVAKFLNANPERWNEPAAGLVVDALQTAFPCKPK